ncbi:hypothetical protein M885DRAFT_626869 [Pelagophyceae sp. CCMP2097]|nr:hypothetical protein M885DRAFT_626869 [Pelagophyceae sp. CCMP2097]
MAAFIDELASHWTKKSIRMSGSCLEEQQETVLLMPCRHGFCRACATTYIKSNSDTQSMPCPVCRSPSALKEIVTAAGENLVARTAADRLKTRGLRGARVYDCVVTVRAVACGEAYAARHASAGDETPSALATDLWVICDSCYFRVQATASSLTQGDWKLLFHIKKLPSFCCEDEIIVRTAKADAPTTTRKVSLADLPSGVWSMVDASVVHISAADENVCVTMCADRTDWRKSGIIVDCLCAKPHK